MPLTAGTRVGPYEIVAPLGAGGMGEVYRARDTRRHRDVALKILHSVLEEDAGRRARFGREAQARAVILVSEATLPLVDAEELQALVAHEVGHEYVLAERERAFKVGDRGRLKDLELMAMASPS